MNDPMEAIKDLKRRLNETTGPMGMEVMQLSIAPGDGMHHPDTIQVVFLIDPKVTFKTPEELATERAFRELQLNHKAQVEIDRFEEARQGLMRRIGEDGDLLPEGATDTPSTEEQVPQPSEEVFDLPIEEIERRLRELDGK